MIVSLIPKSYPLYNHLATSRIYLLFLKVSLVIHVPSFSLGFIFVDANLALSHFQQYSLALLVLMVLMF